MATEETTQSTGPLAIVLESEGITVQMLSLLLKTAGFQMAVHKPDVSMAQILRGQIPEFIILDPFGGDEALQIIDQVGRSSKFRDTKLVMYATSDRLEEGKRRLASYKPDALFSMPLNGVEFVKTLRSMVNSTPKRRQWTSPLA